MRGLIKVLQLFNKIVFALTWRTLKRLKLKKLMVNDATAKLLIILGVLRWTDLPHLHHPLIHLRTHLEEAHTDA